MQFNPPCDRKIMKKEYEESIREICQLSNWRKPYGVPIDDIVDAAQSEGKEDVKVAESMGFSKEDYEQSVAERKGAIGVAITLAYLSGVNASIGEMSRHLNISPSNIEAPFRNLLVNGVFSSRQDIRADDKLNGSAEPFYSGQFYRTQSDQMKLAWCTIAGLASGLTGLDEIEQPVAQ